MNYLEPLRAGDTKSFPTYSLYKRSTLQVTTNGLPHFEELNALYGSNGNTPVDKSIFRFPQSFSININCRL